MYAVIYFIFIRFWWIQHKLKSILLIKVIQLKHNIIETYTGFGKLMGASGKNIMLLCFTLGWPHLYKYLPFLMVVRSQDKSTTQIWEKNTDETIVIAESLTLLFMWFVIAPGLYSATPLLVYLRRQSLITRTCSHFTQLPNRFHGQPLFRSNNTPLYFLSINPLL